MCAQAAGFANKKGTVLERACLSVWPHEPRAGFAGGCGTRTGMWRTARRIKSGRLCGSLWSNGAAAAAAAAQLWRR